MPKHIQGIRDLILKNTKETIVNDGYDALAIRDIAAKCGSSVGTIYHYFPSKEVLVASVMLEDWLNVLEEIKKDAQSKQDIFAVMDCVYHHVVGFQKMYQGTWDYCGSRDNLIPAIRARHDELVNQLADVIRPQLQRFSIKCEEAMPEYLADMLLMVLNHGGNRTAKYEPIFRRLLSDGKDE